MRVAALGSTTVVHSGKNMRGFFLGSREGEGGMTKTEKRVVIFRWWLVGIEDEWRW